MKRTSIVFFCLVIALMTALSAITFLLPAREFSDNENRVLAQLPPLTWESVLDGSYQEALADFLSDQVPEREFWIRANTALKKMLGKKEINGVYLGKDGYYFQQFTNDSFSESRTGAIFSLIGQFAKKQSVPVNIMIVPTPGAVLSEKLPANAPFYDADAMWDKLKAATPGCNFIDLRESFASLSDSTQLYYRTDHHWTTQGAYYAYRNYCASLGLEAKALQNFGITKVSDDFYGTIYSKTLDGKAKPDDIWAIQNLPACAVTFDGTTPGSLYDESFLEKKDQYAYFFGGNWGRVDITTGAKNGKHLFVFKDSFANSFVPYLLEEYAHITMLDLRYFSGNVAQTVQESGATEILFLYEMTNLLTDTGINKLAR